MRRVEGESVADRSAVGWRRLDAAQRRFLWLAGLGFVLAALFALASLFFAAGARKGAAAGGPARLAPTEATE